MSDPRLQYSVVRGHLDRLRQFALDNPSEAGSVQAQLADLEKRENALAIQAGIRQPPPKFEAPKHDPAPPRGWFRMELPDDEGYVQSGRALREFYAKSGRNDLVAALDQQDEERYQARVRNVHVGKAVTEERDRILADQRAGVGYTNWTPHHIEQHLFEFAKTVKVPELAPPTWLESAPAGSVDPRLIKESDLATMSEPMRNAYLVARGLRQPASDLFGNPTETTGPFRKLQGAEIDTPIGAPIGGPKPIAPGSQVAIGSVTREQVMGMSSADQRAYLNAQERAIRGEHGPAPFVEGQTIGFVSTPQARPVPAVAASEEHDRK